MSLIILDRDGVINHESRAYIKNPDEWQAIPGSLKAIADLNRAGYQVVVATNQSGLARGLYDLGMLEKIHQKFLSQLHEEGGKIADIFFCPHHPQEGCECRKPRPGMLLKIQQKYDIDLSKTYFVGDSFTDILVARNVGCKPILVLTGNGEITLSENASLTDTLIFPDLARVAEFVIHGK
jgi:D-glycero-D-manno-heptose 1,7-bisphosphate phosphatase